ncbi:hypothetical protein OH76DRAFT_1487321 [Lentinus brumalis]|uniref:Uncharacterized protein n=1 Tax=Lentinus brumalis TaxID=2498619 RepID=A0A371CUZ8_9APHY|nr:hypothetical protein OH76DRAFT_1487321 [Polyporus brumalis]
MGYWSCNVTGAQWWIASSIFASNNTDRIRFTYGEFLEVMVAMKFRPHDTLPGVLRPRKGRCATTMLEYNPLNLAMDRKMSYRRQKEVKRQLRKRYGIQLSDFVVMRPMEWEDPADLHAPVPLEDPGTLPQF